MSIKIYLVGFWRWCPDFSTRYLMFHHGTCAEELQGQNKIWHIWYHGRPTCKVFWFEGRLLIWFVVMFFLPAKPCGHKHARTTLNVWLCAQKYDGNKCIFKKSGWLFLPTPRNVRFCTYECRKCSRWIMIPTTWRNQTTTKTTTTPTPAAAAAAATTATTTTTKQTATAT